jgi:crotonobetainyl-CoA:carnitine CoA-transferase CaiB-like acyl-CoA transferase
VDHFPRVAVDQFVSVAFTTFNQLNLGVRSLAAGLRMEEARQVIRRLIPLCDVVMENMRGPVVRKWGLDYESVPGDRT